MGQYSTKTDVANAALSLLGEGPIANLDATPDPTDKVLSALQFWYGKAFEMVLRDVNLELYASFVSPVLLVDNTASPFPANEWKYFYYLDPLWINFVRVFSGVYPDSKETEVPHRKISSPSGNALTITGISLANPCVITVAGAQEGQVVAAAAVVGTVEVNGKTYYLKNVTATTAQLWDLSTGAAVNSSAFTAYTSGGTLTPVAHERLYCNLVQLTDPVTLLPMSPKCEVGVAPEISLWPADFALAVATKLAVLSAVPIIGIDRKAQADTLRTDYITAKNNASANMAKESFKGVRKLSRSTLSRISRSNYGDRWRP